MFLFLLACGVSDNDAKTKDSKSTFTSFQLEEKGVVALKVTSEGVLLGPRPCDGGPEPTCDDNLNNLYPMVNRKGITIRYDQTQHALVQSNGNTIYCNDKNYQQAVDEFRSKVSSLFSGIDESNTEIAACVSVHMF